MARTIERNIANSWNNICKIFFFSKLHKFNKTFKRNNLKVNSGYTPKKKKKKKKPRESLKARRKTPTTPVTTQRQAAALVNHKHGL